MTRKLWLIAVFALCIQPATADDKGAAAKVVRTTVETVLECLRNKDLPDESKRDRIIEIINPVFDFPLMGKLALGRRQWPRLNEDQKTEYTRLFIKQLQNSYADKIALFSNETVKYEEPTRVKTKIHVATTVVSKGERSKMLYKLHKSEQGWKVYDVEIQGVSVVSSYRAQYAQVLETGSIEELLKKMKDEISAGGDDDRRL